MNIVFVLVDDLRFDGMGFLQPEVKTPNIDKLAKNGLYFKNALVTSSLCSPSRATILTGQTARNHRVVDNTNSSEEGLVFFPEYLQEAGYQTGFFGKWHMGDESDKPRKGFNRWVSFMGQGAYYPTDMIPAELIEEGVINQLNVDGKHVDQKGYITDELTDYAMNWLEEGREPNKPFFLYLSHKAVHNDAKPAERHRKLYENTEFKLPLTASQTDESKPLWVKNQRNSWHGIDFFYASDKKMTDYLKEYYGALASVDDSLGRIWNYLNSNNLLENTMIVFYSDNGFMIGEHGLIDKRNAYEGSIKVPMIVAFPGHDATDTITNAIVRNLDLAPTFLDAAGIEKPKQFEGVSFLSLLSDSKSKKDWVNPDFVYEYYWDWAFPMTPTTFAIQNGAMKYIQYHGVWDIEELYNTNTDPLEIHNLAYDNDYIDTLTMMRESLFQYLSDQNNMHNIPFSERYSTGIISRNAGGQTAAQFPKTWLVEPNRPDRLNGLFPDTPLKLKYQREGKAYFPVMERENNLNSPP